MHSFNFFKIIFYPIIYSLLTSSISHSFESSFDDLLKKYSAVSISCPTSTWGEINIDISLDENNQPYVFNFNGKSVKNYMDNTKAYLDDYDDFYFIQTLTFIDIENMSSEEHDELWENGTTFLIDINKKSNFVEIVERGYAEMNVDRDEKLACKILKSSNINFSLFDNIEDYIGERVRFIDLPIRICNDFFDACQDWTIQGDIVFYKQFFDNTIAAGIDIWFNLPVGGSDSGYGGFEIDQELYSCYLKQFNKAIEWIEISKENKVNLDKRISEDNIGCYVPKYFSVVNDNYSTTIGISGTEYDRDYNYTAWIKYDEFLKLMNFIFEFQDNINEAINIINVRRSEDSLFQ